MKRILFVTFLLVSVFVGSACAQRMVHIGDGYSSTSVNATIFRKNSVVSQGGYQFAAYYDAEGYVNIASRKLKEQKFHVHRTQYRGKISDAHNIISIGIDGDGYLHVSFDHHNNKLRYCRSLKPYSTEVGSLQPMTGDDEEKVTYPEFYTLHNGDVLFVYRSGKSGQGNLVMNRYDVRTKEWSRVQNSLVDGEGQRNAYWQMQVDSHGIIHLSWVWRETWLVETNHDLCYARSCDGGKTWENSVGEPYSLPITAKNAEYIVRIPQKSELINQTSIAADDNSNPYIASYWRDENDSVPQYKLVYKDNGEWKVKTVSNRHMKFSLSGGGTKMIPMSRPQVAVRNKGGKTIVNYIYRDAEEGSKVSVSVNNNLFDPKSQWKINTPCDVFVDAWEPSFDTNLWQTNHRLHIYVQRVSQGDGEKTVNTLPQPVSILEY